MQHSRNGFRQIFRSLSIPDFRQLWLGMFLSMAANQIDIVARAWLAYTISGSATTLGVVLLARGLPMMVFALLGGVAADRFDKRKLLIVVQTAMGALALLNALLVHLGIVEVWHLVVLGALQGAIFPVIFPARTALIPELVARKDLPNAIAVTSTGNNVNRVLGPVVAGLLLSWDPAVAFYAIAVAYGGGALTLLRLPPVTKAARQTSGAISEVLATFEHIWKLPRLRTLMLMAFLPVALGMPFQQLLPVFQEAVLHVGPAELGILYTFSGIGALAGSVLIARFSSSSRLGLLQMISGLGFGVSLLCFSLSGSFALSAVLLLFVGLSSQGYFTINNTLIVLETRPQEYGRVFGVYMVTWGLMPIATLPLGALSDAVGAPATLASAGALLAIFFVAIILLDPKQWRAAAAKDEA